MKVLVACQSDIRAPAEAVFAYVCDLDRWPAWFGPIVSAVCEDRGPLGVGVRVGLCLADGRRRRQENFEVTRFIRHAFLSLEAAYSAARRIDFRVERRGGWTRLGCAVGYPVFGGALPALYHQAVGRRRLRRSLHESLVRIRHIIEEEWGQGGGDTRADVPERDDPAAGRPESAAMRVG
jgi:hypothetical protein